MDWANADSLAFGELYSIESSPESALNLLTTPTIMGASGSGAVKQHTLPGLLAALWRGDVDSLPRVRPHQEAPAYAFLVQLALLAVEGGSLIPAARTEAEPWKQALLSLADDNPTAWMLVVEDPTQPAFFQPPVPAGEDLAKYQAPLLQPDAIDTLVTSKSHDQKANRILHPTAEHWVWALVCLQTFEGFSGRGNYGSSRMNGGFASRPLLRTTTSLTLSSQFVEEVRRLEGRAKKVATAHGFDVSGQRLLWTTPWDGAHSFAISELHPHFIEVTRRVRLVDCQGAPGVRIRPTAASRVGAKERYGNIGDPWTAVALGEKGETKALTVSGNGYHYGLASKLLTGDGFEIPDAMKGPGQTIFWAEALARGKGEINGLHRRIIPIPDSAQSIFTKPSDRERTAAIAGAMVADATTARNKILRFALKVLLDDGEVDGRPDDRPDRWIQSYERQVDHHFFPAMWGIVAATGDDELPNLEPWRRQLYAIAKAVFEDAIDTAPRSTARGWKAIVVAERILTRSAYKHFNFSREGQHEHDTDSA